MMLDAFIIEEIKKIERKKQEDNRPQIEIPLEEPEPQPEKEDTKEVIFQL